MGMIAQKQSEQYETQMSNTAIQRQSADAEAAGINPMTFANSGSMAASSPSASAYSSGGLAEAVGSAMNVANGISQIGLNSANSVKALTDASNQTASVQSQIGLNSANTALATANANEVSKNAASHRKLEANIGGASQARSAKDRAFAPAFDAAGGAISSAVDAASKALGAVAGIFM